MKKEGFFLAKRQLLELIDYKIFLLTSKMEDLEEAIVNPEFYKINKAKLQELEDIRNYIKNVMLWNSEDD